MFRLKIFLLTVALIFLFGCSPNPRFKSDMPQEKEVKNNKILDSEELFVKVGIIRQAKSVKISSKTTLKLFSLGKRIKLNQKSLQINLIGEKFLFEKTPLAEKNLLIISETPISVNGQEFHGKIALRISEGKMNVINRVKIQDYLKGVVPSEMPASNPNDFEALKAQAITARTYVLRNLGKYKDLGIDVWSTTQDQVYKGIEGEAKLSNKAVEETATLVLAHEGKIAITYFSSTCGGKTENNSVVWSGIQEPYLKGITDSFGKEFFCEESPHYRWKEEFSREELEEMLSQNLGSNYGQLFNIKILERTMSGRVSHLQFIFSGGTVNIKNQNEIRNALKRNSKILRSTFFKIDLELDSRNWIQKVILTGAGNGHGVGMCQWGAMGMSKKGYTYDKILGHYYKGTKIIPFTKADLVSMR